MTKYFRDAESVQSWKGKHMDPYSLTEHQVLITDCAVLVAIVGVFGLLFLMTAFDGASVHGLGMLGNVHWKGRYIALIGGNVVALGPVALVYLTKGVTPVDLWNAASIWWSEGFGFGWAIAFITWWVLFSPIQSLLALTRIERAKWKEYVASLEAHIVEIERRPRGYGYRRI